MKITEFLDVKGIHLDLRANEKHDILKELVDVLAEVKDIGDKKLILKALLERESLGSTGIGQGIAIPHGKTDKVKELISVLAISKQGVNFEALDGEPVYIFFLLVAPKDAAGPHLKRYKFHMLRDTISVIYCVMCRTSL
jgi:mannitol/fructose-specific phosphotransferase system IIA component (Ntr-type)